MRLRPWMKIGLEALGQLPWQGGDEWTAAVRRALALVGVDGDEGDDAAASIPMTETGWRALFRPMLLSLRSRDDVKAGRLMSAIYIGAMSPEHIGVQVVWNGYEPLPPGTPQAVTDYVEAMCGRFGPPTNG